MTETQERFLAEIATRVPLEQVAELHLFPSLRQGQMESGVAVVAVTLTPEPDAPPPAAGSNAAGDRLTIYSAHYRLTIKGPDRGKWEMSAAAEADAPLITLEAVVRGVRHRAGDGAETERLTGDEFRAALADAGGLAWNRAWNTTK